MYVMGTLRKLRNRVALLRVVWRLLTYRGVFTMVIMFMRLTRNLLTFGNICPLLFMVRGSPLRYGKSCWMVVRGLRTPLRVVALRSTLLISFVGEMWGGV